MYVALRQEALVDTPWAFCSSPGKDRGSDPEGVRASLGGEGYAIAGAFENGRLVSIAGLLREGQEKRSHIAMVVGVYTAPAARGKGFARKVMETVIAKARAWQGVACVELSVSERAREARAMYESIGFVAWGVEPDALRVGSQSYSEVHMRLGL